MARVTARVLPLLSSILLLTSAATAGTSAASQPTAPPSGNATSSLVKVSYDSSKDQTHVGFTDLQIATDTSRQLLMNLGGSYPGKVAKVPDQFFVQFTVRAAAQGFSLRHDTEFCIIVDGTKVLERPFKNYGYQSEGQNGPYIEPLISLWPFEALRTIAHGKTIEFKLGEWRFSVEGRGLQALRDVVTHFEH